MEDENWNYPDWDEEIPGADDGNDCYEIPSIHLTLNFQFFTTGSISVEMEGDDKFHYYEIFTVDNIQEAMIEFEIFLKVIRYLVQNGKFEASPEKIFDLMGTFTESAIKIDKWKKRIGKVQDWLNKF